MNKRKTKHQEYKMYQQETNSTVEFFQLHISVILRLSQIVIED